jgi:hypothetical protein
MNGLAFSITEGAATAERIDHVDGVSTDRETGSLSSLW